MIISFILHSSFGMEAVWFMVRKLTSPWKVVLFSQSSYNRPYIVQLCVASRAEIDSVAWSGSAKSSSYRAPR